MHREPLQITSSETPAPKPKRPPSRSWAVQEKRRIVEECFVPGTSVSTVARKNDINTNLLFRWRQQYRRGDLGPTGAQPRSSSPEFVSVGVIGDDGRLVAGMAAIEPKAPILDQAALSQGKRAEAPPSATEPPSGRVDLQLACGVRITFDAAIDGAALRRLITVIKETV
jgi:hypothetical protein